MGGPPVSFDQLRGVNYIANTTQARDHIQAMLDPDDTIITHPPGPRLQYPGGRTAGPFFGQFDRDLVELEIRFLADRSGPGNMGFNSIRIYPTFFAWLLNRKQYTQNLRHTVRICRDVGVRITVVVWGASLAKRVLFEWLDPLIPPGSPSNLPQHWIKLVTDVHHHNRYSGGLYVPLEGTFFELYQWGDLPGPRVTTQPDWHSWNALYPNLSTLARNRIDELMPGDGIGEAMDLYLSDMGSCFADDPGRSAFLSYDLFNEVDSLIPGLPDNPAQPALDNVRTFLGRTIDRLESVHSEAVFTVGLGSGFNLRPFYLHFEARRPGVMRYASYHDFSPALYGNDPQGLLDEVLMARAQLERTRGNDFPLVCSEFYTPYVSPGGRSEYAHARGRLGNITDTLVRNRIGGQMWAVLESNVSVPDLVAPDPHLAASPGVVPTDGLFVPRDRDTGFDWSWNNGQRVFELVQGARGWTGWRSDFDSVLRWTGVLS